MNVIFVDILDVLEVVIQSVLQVFDGGQRRIERAEISRRYAIPTLIDDFVVKVLRKYVNGGLVEGSFSRLGEIETEVLRRNLDTPTFLGDK